MPEKVLWIKSWLLDYIISGSKDLDVRVGLYNIRKLTVDDQRRFSCKKRSCLVRITAIRKYSSFRHMLNFEDHNRIVPGMPPLTLLGELRQIYPSDKERLGVYVIEFEKESP